METLVEDDELSIIWMYKTETQCCPEQEIDVWIHRFKVSIKEQMSRKFRNKYCNVYNATKKLLDSIADDELRELVSFELQWYDFPTY